jgi:RNA polymerase sigma-70 factor (ECF subfamily)
MYRAPILAYIREYGYGGSEAEDLTQSFLMRFVERSVHASADPSRGRFRAFLQTALRNFINDAADHAQSEKRGGATQVRSLESLSGDESPTVGDCDLPESAFDRAWAQTVLQAALSRLRDEARAASKEELFNHLFEFLIESPDIADYERVAAAMSVRRNTLAVAVHRMRHRLRELVCEVLTDTATDASDLERELNDLQHTLGAVMQ